MKRMAILEIHPKIFRELLQLPEGADISDMRLNIERRGVLEVKIDGAGWEVREGECLMRTTGTVTTDEAGRRTIEWGMPSNGKGVGPAESRSHTTEVLCHTETAK